MSHNNIEINTGKTVQIILKNPFACVVRLKRLSHEEIRNATSSKKLKENAKSEFEKMCKPLLSLIIANRSELYFF